MMITRHASTQRKGASGTLEGGLLPILLIDEPDVFPSQEGSSGSTNDLLGINQQVAWIEGTLNVSF
jgi:hypothetical protein